MSHPKLQEVLSRVATLLHFGQTDPAAHVETLQDVEAEAIGDAVKLLDEIATALCVKYLSGVTSSPSVEVNPMGVETAIHAPPGDPGPAPGDLPPSAPSVLEPQP